jgi:fucose permease
MAPVAGSLAGRFGRRWLIVAGLALTALGCASIAPLSAHSVYWHALPGLILLGMGVMTVLTTATDLVMATSGQGQSGSAAALAAATIQVGGAIGIGVITSTFISGARHEFQAALAQLGYTPDQAAPLFAAMSNAVRETALHQVPQLPDITVQTQMQLVNAYAEAAARGVGHGFALAAILAAVAIPAVLVGMRHRRPVPLRG